MVVRDTSGNIIAQVIISNMEAQGATPDLLVQAIPEGLKVCPQAVTGQHVLRFKSYATEAVQVWQGQELLVSLEPAEEKEAGPITDWSWHLPRELEIRDAQGNSDRFAIGGTDVSYKLGEIPTVLYSITQNPFVE
jgi:hypothetical protein